MTEKIPTSYTPNRVIQDPAVRTAVYGLVVAVGVILVALNVVTAPQWDMILGLVGAIGALIVAMANVPKSP